MILFLVFLIIVNIVLLIFLGYSVYKFKAAQNIMKNFNIDLDKIDFQFWNNYGVGGIDEIKKD